MIKSNNYLIIKLDNKRNNNYLIFCLYYINSLKLK